MTPNEHANDHAFDTPPPTVQPPHDDPPLVKDATIGADWSIINDHRAEGILREVADHIGSMYGKVTTADDMYQEGAIILALAPNNVRAYLQDPLFGERALFLWLRNKTLDTIRSDINRAGLTVPLTPPLDNGE